MKSLKVVSDCAELAIKDINILAIARMLGNERSLMAMANHYQQLVNFKTMKKEKIYEADYSIQAHLPKNQTIGIP